jgi:hypothetical protein
LGRASCVSEAKEDAKFYIVTWNIKDGFWTLDCGNGEEWEFVCILPQEEDKPIQLVVPILPEMGWVESPADF